ncbi:unnamed protein product [Arctia plantaginis]|uniref:Uncharacterized protein n=1 Tax=Arctia plantaginis TaxID=874455 RepID=A0A8S1BC29_ARCPL|nr:unnamed protein product [Arctia plantaginis]
MFLRLSEFLTSKLNRGSQVLEFSRNIINIFNVHLFMQIKYLASCGDRVPTRRQSVRMPPHKVVLRPGEGPLDTGSTGPVVMAKLGGGLCPGVDVFWLRRRSLKRIVMHFDTLDWA